jgi:DNA-binding NarL/FixJ family response regulator
MERARVLLAEDHAAVAEQLQGVLEARFDVVAVMHDGFALIRAAQTLKPDVIVADIGLPGADGLTAAESILKSDPTARIVFVTVHNEQALVKCAMDLGALGYVLKLCAGDDLLEAVAAAMRQERFLSPLLRYAG